VIEDDHPVGQGQGVAHLLLDHQQGRALLPQPSQAGVQLVDDDRGEAKRRLVGDQQLGPLDQDPGQREHPLRTVLPGKSSMR
jgi:hypothetical protein